ncbi:maltose acetyltransferase domain-containing protein [Robinsoniella peoriensis]
MTEREKMLAGMLYDCGDEELQCLDWRGRYYSSGSGNW